MTATNEKSPPLPLVSVITPSYNAMPYILENIASIHSQDYPNIEHIIFDGGSTDGTKEVLQTYQHLNWVSEPDAGQSDALNKGFRKAKGEIIGWLNADDVYHPQAVHFAVQYLLEHPDVDVIYGDLQIIDENSHPISISKSEDFDLERLLLINYVKQPTVFMRRRVIDKMHGVDENLHYVMDWELWLRMGSSFKLQYIPNQILASFRLCPGTKSFDSGLEFNSEWKQVLETMLQGTVLSSLKKSTKHNALKRVQTQLQIANMVKAAKEQKRGQMLIYLSRAVAVDWTILFNRGIYLFIFQGLIGSPVDRLRKYRNV